MSTPFFGQIFTFTQPDGSTIELRGWGDQHAATFETLDGYTVVLNPTTGYYETAALSADGADLVPTGVTAGSAPPAGVQRGLRARADTVRARAMQRVSELGLRRCDERRLERRAMLRATRSARANGGIAPAPPQRATVGDYLGLCILVDFSDAPATIPQQDVDAFCNQPGYTGHGNNGSVYDYYFDNSIGRCRYKNLVTPYYRAANPKSYYTDPTIKPFAKRARELIAEALTHLQAMGFDFSALTADTGGNVYATNVFYAGPITNNWSEGLWPHSSSLSTRFTVALGKGVRDYQVTALGQQLELGTFCHENGHMLCDYPDLYDYGHQSSGVGYFCLMCAGNNASQMNPVQISAYLKRLSGWDNTTVVLQDGQQATLSAATNDFAIHAKNDTEYFLIENRAKTGRDAALPGAGLAIWHVDEEGDNSNEQMTAAMHYELSLEQADGGFQLERSRSLGDPNDLFGNAVHAMSGATVPNTEWWDGTASSLTIDQISAPGPAMTFRSLLSTGGPPAALVRVASTPNVAIPDNNIAGVSNTITIADVVTILALRVGVDLTHTFQGDLVVSLTAPWGDVVVLHPKNQGGGTHDLHQVYDEATAPAFVSWRGRPATGAWRLSVQDLAANDVGTFDGWAVEIDPASASSDIVLTEAPGTLVPDNDAAGITRALTCTTAGQLTTVEVSVDITHPFAGDLRLSLRSPAGSIVVLRDQVGGSADNVVATFTAATTPALAALTGQPRLGGWALTVADVAGTDVGKLNSWRLVLR